MKALIGGCAAVLAAAVIVGRVSAAASCDTLAKLTLTNTTITSAQMMPAGPFTPPGRAPGSIGAARLDDLPAFCRVAATLTPSADSNIKIEVWMPATAWNGRFQGVGNGGWSGALSYGPPGAALRRGYAAASTDTGHSGGSGRFALGHPEKLTDFGYRAVHEMTVQSKAIVAAFYGAGPRHSYWTGCSSGGKQGLKEAQRFPADYDGIVAGAPANFWTHLMIGTIWIGQATLKDATAYIPRDKYPVIHKAALAACDATDGVHDGLIEDPTRCRFDPGALLCTNGDGQACLTAAQVEAARKIYAGATNPRSHRISAPALRIAPVHFASIRKWRTTKAPGALTLRRASSARPDDETARKAAACHGGHPCMARGGALMDPQRLEVTAVCVVSFVCALPAHLIRRQDACRARIHSCSASSPAAASSDPSRRARR